MSQQRASKATTDEPNYGPSEVRFRRSAFDHINRYVAGALYLIAQQSSGRQSENSTFMGPKDIARSADVEMQALAKEMAEG